MHVLFYVLASSLWSSGNKGWPMKKFAQQEVLLTKAKSIAKNETDDFYELVCNEVEILLNGEDSLAVLKNQMKASQRHECIGGEVLSARKILDAHLSQRIDKYLWVKELIDDPVKHSEDMISKNQVSIESLVYFWNFWKEKIILMIECLGCRETQVVNVDRSYQKFCLNYLGVWRLSHHMNPVYVLLFSDADWVRDVDKRYFRSHGKLVSVDAHQLVSAAQNYWSSEFLSVGIEVLEKVDALFKFANRSSESTFFQSKALTLIYDVAIYLLNSKCLRRRNQNTKTLQKFVTSSTAIFVAYMFPLDCRKSLTQNMISLRRTVASKNVLHQVIVEYTSLNNELSSGQIGMIVMIILGSGKLNSELCKKLVKKLDGNPPWKDFIENLCVSSPGPGNTSQEPREVTVMWRFVEALGETYNANWRVVKDYITPGCFVYLVERLLIWATCFQGYVITTSSCFTEWLMYQDEDKSLSTVVANVRPSIQGILHFVIKMVSECLCEMGNLIDADWKSCCSLLVPRLVVLLCLLYVNSGMCLDILSNLLGRSYITEQLPWEFSDTLKRMRKHNSFNINVEVLAAALKKIDNTMVIASFGLDCSTFLCSDCIFFDMKANQCKDDIFRKMFPKPPVIQVEAEGNSSGPNDTDAGSVTGSKLLPLNSSLVGETDKQSDGQSRGKEICKAHVSTPKCPQPDASTSATQANKKGNRKKHKGRKGRK